MRKALPQQKVTEIYDHSAKRYDWLHSLLTASADKRGRHILVDKTVANGDYVLDAGSGTGSTAILAAQKSEPDGKIVMFDISSGMLEKAKEKMTRAGLQNRIEIQQGDMLNLPFEDDTFDAVLSTYSLDPLSDPEKGVLELFRVARRGGIIGIGHSVAPGNKILKWLDDKIEDLVWHFSSISLGCRPINILPIMEKAGAKLLYSSFIGVPLWPFQIIVLKKPAKL